MPPFGDRSRERSPQRRLVDDLLYACMGPVLALVLGRLMNDDLTGYPLTFGVTWLVVGLLMATSRYLLARRHAA